jgi:hypothetical protein
VQNRQEAQPHRVALLEGGRTLERLLRLEREETMSVLSILDSRYREQLALIHFSIG